VVFSTVNSVLCGEKNLVPVGKRRAEKVSRHDGAGRVCICQGWPKERRTGGRVGRNEKNKKDRG